MRQRVDLVRSETNLARRTWPGISQTKLTELRLLIRRYKLSVTLGDVLFLGEHWYVTHAGLLRLARRSGCLGIRSTLIEKLSYPANNRWVFKATVYNLHASNGFVGYGDADPSNVSSLVRGAEMRVAETRAVNRALRKAYGIGLCSVEELKYLTPASDPVCAGTGREHANGNGHGQPRLRDRLCLLIRQHQLDPTLVKRYAADFCGTQELREAKRDLVESFITHLAEWAAKDRDGLICKLNGYAQPPEVQT